ncbi:MAG: ATP-binding cassette domain-containing protein [Prevotellaceae bacterium]|nr:ATP-binding cassette domain-containing protein [Prevotellaceae bacterium]
MSRTNIRDLSVCYAGTNGTTHALDRLSFSLSDGEIWGIVGPSGCGKSTLLRVLAGVLTTYDGEVSINGTRPDPKRQSIGLIPQNYALLNWKRVEENIFLPFVIRRTYPDRAYADAVIHSLGLDSLLRRYPHELSGGQQQRVALARSFIQQPDLLLMDEPFSALDTLTAERCRRLFREVWQENPVSTLLVTHNIFEAAELCSHVAILSQSPGRLVRVLHTPTAEDIRLLIETQWTEN